MKEVSVILFCAIKFAMTFPFAIYGLQMSFWEVILYSNIGGLLGLLVSAYLSKAILWTWHKLVTERFKRVKTKKKVFTKRNRRLIRVKMKFGFPGIVILTPVLLSIPIGGFLMTKYYGLKLKYLAWMFSGQVGWSFLYTVFYIYIKAWLFQLT